MLLFEDLVLFKGLFFIMDILNLKQDFDGEKYWWFIGLRIYLGIVLEVFNILNGKVVYLFEVFFKFIV